MRLKISPILKRIANVYQTKVPKTVIEATKRRINRDTLKLITNISDDMRDQIGQVLREGEEQGRSVAATASKLLTTGLDKGIFKSARKRAYLIARTELHRARQRAAVDLYKAAEIKLVKWVGIGDGRICADCKALNGRTFRVDDIEDRLPPLHPRCRCRLLPNNYDLKIIARRAGVTRMKIVPRPDEYKYVIRVPGLKRMAKSLENFEKSKRVFVPAGVRHKAYYRTDPREKQEVLYHGTYEQFKRFLPPDEVPEEVYNPAQHALGIYTSDSKEFAETFGDKIVKVIKPKKTLDLINAKTFDDFVALLPIDKEKEKWKLNRMKIDSAWGDNEIDMQYKLIESLDDKFDIVKKLKQQGYDSLRFKEEHQGKKANTTVIFEPEKAEIVKAVRFSDLEKQFNAGAPSPGPASTIWEAFEGFHYVDNEETAKNKRKAKKEPTVTYGGDMYNPQITKAAKEYSSVLAELSPMVADMVLTLGTKIDPLDLHEKTKENDYPHITVRYGLHTDSAEDAQRALDHIELPIKAAIVGVEIFERDEYDVLVLQANSPAIEEMNDKLGELPNTETFKDYHPHITIAYLQKGTGQKYKDMDIGQLVGQVIEITRVDFSDKEHHKVALEKAQTQVRSHPMKTKHGVTIRRQHARESKESYEMAGTIESHLDKNNPEVKLAYDVAEAIDKAGGRALFVGGSVRDALLGKRAKDVDIEVYNLNTYDLNAVLNKIGDVDAVGKSFGVFKVSNPDVPAGIDVSTPRREKKTGIGHKGFDVEADPTMTVKEAARRRDLTINSMAYDPIKKQFLDPYNGLQDLKDRKLRAVSKDTFTDDSLRVLRVMRFAGQLGMLPDEELVNICRKIDLSDLPKERLMGELSGLLLKSNKPSTGLRLIPLLGIDKIIPEVTDLEGVLQEPDWHPEGDAWEHTMQVVDAAASIRDRLSDPKDQLVFMLAAVLHDIGKPATTLMRNGVLTTWDHDEVGADMVPKVLDRFTNEPDVIEKVEALVRHHMDPTFFHHGKIGDAGIRRLAKKVNIPMVVMVSMADKMGRGERKSDLTAEKWLLDKYAELGLANPKALDPIVMGRHLIPLGIQPGKEMGNTLKKIYEAQLDGKFKTVEEGLEYARNEGWIGKSIIVEKSFNSLRKTNVKLLLDRTKALQAINRIKKSKIKYVPYRDNGEVVWAKRTPEMYIMKNVKFEKGDAVLMKGGDVGHVTAVGKDGLTARDDKGNKYQVWYKDAKKVVRR